MPMLPRLKMKAPTIQVIETFVMHSSQFVEQLQEDGIEAGVHSFDRLTSTLAYPTGGDISEIVKSPDGSENSESNGKMGQNLAIVTMTVSGIVIVGVFGLFSTACETMNQLMMNPVNQNPALPLR